jgi:hypothetical protein
LIDLNTFQIFRRAAGGVTPRKSAMEVIVSPFTNRCAISKVLTELAIDGSFGALRDSMNAGKLG